MSKVLAVGDIHAKTWMVYEIAEFIDLYDHVIFLGDYADNFNTPPTHSLACWRLVRQLMQHNPNVHALIGNHDYSYIHPEIAGKSSGWHPVTFTLINTPENKKIKDWLLSLPARLEIDGVTYSHAGITEQWDGKEDVQGMWNDASPIWARPNTQFKYKDIKQVFGHTPSKEIWNPAPTIWCIDTFSQDQQNNFIGDQTLLEIIDGNEFNVVKPKEIINENNNSAASVENPVS